MYRRRVVLIGGSVCLIGAIAAVAVMRSRRTTGTTRALSFEQYSLDAGEAVAGILRTATFKFHNRGTRPVEIREVRSSCSCNGKSKFPVGPIPPGVSGQIDVSFLPKGGAREALFIVEDADGKDTPLTIRYRGRVDFALASDTLDFGPVMTGEEVTREVAIMGDKDLAGTTEVKVAASTTPWLRAQIVRWDGPPAPDPTPEMTPLDPESGVTRGRLVRVATLKVTARGSTKGAFNERIMIAGSDAQGRRAVSLACVGQCRDEISVVPSRILLSDDGKPQTDEVVITSIGSSFRVLNAEVAAVSAVAPSASASGNESHIRLSRGTGSRSGSDVLRIRLDHPRVSELAVPVVQLGGN
jgi:hypothetical protein